MANEVNVIVAAGVVLERENKYLLVQEKKERAKGLWNLPAGRVEEGYSIEETAIKEAKEETGFNVELIHKIDIYHENINHAVKHIFEAKIVGGEIKIPSDEIMNAKWYTIEEIRDMRNKLRNNYVLEAIETYINKK